MTCHGYKLAQTNKIFKPESAKNGKKPPLKLFFCDNSGKKSENKWFFYCFFRDFDYTYECYNTATGKGWIFNGRYGT